MSLVDFLRPEAAAVDGLALVSHGIGDVVDLVAGFGLHVTTEYGAPVREHRRQDKLGQVTRHTSATKMAYLILVLVIEHKCINKQILMSYTKRYSPRQGVLLLGGNCEMGM